MTSKTLNATVFVWEIEHFLSLDLKTSNNLTSDSFAIPGCPLIKWQLTCYPKGEDPTKEAGFVSIYLSKRTDECEVEIEFQVELVGEDDGLVKMKKVSPPSRTFAAIRDCCGWAKFVSRDQLKDYNLQDYSTLTFRVKVNRLTRVAYLDESINLHFLNKQLDFDNRKHCDVCLVTEDKTFEAHKFILSGQSQYFDKMFNGDFKEKAESEVDLKTFQSDVIEEVLRFIYTGQVLDLDALSDQLIIAADFFQLDHLKNICQDNMTCRISVENCLQFLFIADKVNSDSLKEEAMSFTCNNKKDIDKSAYENFSKENFSLTVELFFWDVS